MTFERTDYDRLECAEWVIQTFTLALGTKTHVRYRGVLQIIVPCEAEAVMYVERYA